MPYWHVVGDSHVSAFRRAAQLRLLKRRCKFTSVGGATAVGLRNPNSLTDAVSIFKKALLPARQNATPVVHLGEVDCGFVIWWRAKTKHESVEAQMAQSIDAYFAFVDALVAAGYRTVVVTGASLPTIRDGQEWGEVANKRREVSASLRERTDLTLDYNERLRKGSEVRSLPFIDIASEVVDAKSGVIADAFRNHDPSDHHPDPDKVGPLWAAALNAVEPSVAPAIASGGWIARLRRSTWST